jgi:mortality factor 4-like protein 1
LNDFHKDYVENQKRATPLLEDSMKEVVDGLKLYFEKAIGNILLYRFERKQYVDLVQSHPDTPLSDLYGVEHLLRLFGNFS